MCPSTRPLIQLALKELSQARAMDGCASRVSLVGRSHLLTCAPLTCMPLPKGTPRTLRLRTRPGQCQRRHRLLRMRLRARERCRRRAVSRLQPMPLPLTLRPPDLRMRCQLQQQRVDEPPHPFALQQSRRQTPPAASHSLLALMLHVAPRRVRSHLWLGR